MISLSLSLSDTQLSFSSPHLGKNLSFCGLDNECNVGVRTSMVVEGPRMSAMPRKLSFLNCIILLLHCNTICQNFHCLFKKNNFFHQLYIFSFSFSNNPNRRKCKQRKKKSNSLINSKRVYSKALCYEIKFYKDGV